MKPHRQEYPVRPSTEVRGSILLAITLVGLSVASATAWAQDKTAAELTTPGKTLEIGLQGVSQESVKAGEYDGLSRKGVYGILNFELNGGAPYDANDTTRWHMVGRNLGLESREFRMDYGQQGTYRISIGYDELLRSGSALFEGIQSPYLGAGGNSLTLPGNWQAPLYTTAAAMSGTAPTNNYPNPTASMLGLAATGYGSNLVGNTAYLCKSTSHGCAANAQLGGAYTTGLPVTAANTAMLAQNQTDLGDFQSIRLSTKRDKTHFSVAYDLNTQWSVNAGMQREYKQGLKPLGVVNSGNGGYAAEIATIIPQYIDTVTDQYKASIHFKAEHYFLSAAYFGSMFENNALSTTVANPYASGTYNGVTQQAYGVSSATISAEPNSSFHQLRLGGGYDFSSSTRLVADVAYGRNGQNSSYVLDPAMFSTPTGATGAAAANGSVLPVNAANALVITESMDLKLTAHPLPKWKFGTSYKFDQRNNQTPVNTYAWYDDGAKNFGTPGSVLNGASVPGIAAGTPLFSGVNVVANRPYSWKTNEIAGDADYAFARGQALQFGVKWQSIDRSCHGTWIDCAAADTSREKSARLEYRFQASETLKGRLAYDYARRTADYNANAWMSLNPALAATNIPNLAAVGYTGSVLGFLTANGLTPYGLPIAANAASGFTGNTLAAYNLLFGTGNGGLAPAYYGNANVTQNWPGLASYNVANRNRERVRGSLQWEASEPLTLQAGMNYRHDNYPDAVYGLTHARSWALNLDGDLEVSDGLVLSAYLSHEDQRSTSGGNSAGNGSVAAVGATAAASGTRYTTATGATGYNTAVNGLCQGDSNAGLPNGYTPYQLYGNNAKIAPCTGWQSEARERTETLGLAFRLKHAVLAQLGLSGDLNFSRAVSGNDLGGGFYYANPLAAYVASTPAAVVPAVSFIGASALPDVVVNALQLRLVGDYQLTHRSQLRVAYSFKHLQTTDYTYATTQAANTSGTVMPTFVAPPSYNVSVIGVSYAVNFE